MKFIVGFLFACFVFQRRHERITVFDLSSEGCRAQALGRFRMRGSKVGRGLRLRWCSSEAPRGPVYVFRFNIESMFFLKKKKSSIGLEEVKKKDKGLKPIAREFV